MTHAFEQQARSSFGFPKSAATPQHGQKSGQKTDKPNEPRTFHARPGH